MKRLSKKIILNKKDWKIVIDCWNKIMKAWKKKFKI